MPNSHSLPDDELLSAYLDGELTEDQRAAIEKHLKNDPAARQTLAELRQISAAVKSLPAETLGHDLKQRVLERVANPTTTSVAAAIRDDAAGWRRGVVWASLAVAATLLLMVFRRDQPEQPRQLAAIDKQAKRERQQPSELKSSDLKLSAPQPALEAAAEDAGANSLATEPVPASSAAQPTSANLRSAKPTEPRGRLTTIELTVPTTSEQQLPVQEAFAQLLAKHDVSLSKRELASGTFTRDESAESAEAATEVAVLVEATPEQIRSILAACRATPEVFAQVDRLERAPEPPAQQSQAIRSEKGNAKALAKVAPAKKGPTEAAQAWVLDRERAEFAGRAAQNESEQTPPGRVRVLFLLRPDRSASTKIKAKSFEQEETE